MLDHALATLEQSLRPHLPLSKDRRETLALLVVGMVSARTVDLSHIASERPGAALVASTCRRLQRFFQHVELGKDWSAPLAAKLLGLQGSWTLVLDRTQWRVGERDVNFLVLAVVTPRFRVPLMWSVIKGPGCSDTEQRIALMQRYLALFDVSTIRLLLADREFVGVKRLSFLAKSGIPFAISPSAIRHPPSARARTCVSCPKPGTTFPSPRISGIAAGPASCAAASPEWRPTRPS
jgi:hypothetical protein